MVYTGDNKKCAENTDIMPMQAGMHRWKDIAMNRKRGHSGNNTGRGTARKSGCSFRRAGLLALMLLLLLTPAEASAARISKASKTLLKGQSFTLRVKGTSKKVKWSSSNRSVARVNSAGVVKGKKVGTAVITAKVGTQRYTCRVTVRQPVTKLKLSRTGAILQKGKALTLTAKIKPVRAYDKRVVWKSSNSKIASVSDKGKVVAKKAGSVTITVRTRDGSKLSASCRVIVQDPNEPLKLSKKSMKISLGASKTLKVSGTKEAVTWGSSDNSIVNVDAAGNVTAVGVGKAKVSATIADGLWTAYCTVTVTSKDPVPSAEAQRFLNILTRYSAEIQAQQAKGHFLGYSTSTELIKTTWEGLLNDMNTRGIGYTNCAHTVRLALCEMGKLDPSQTFWGTTAGPMYFGPGAEARLRQSCEIIHAEKTVEQLLAEGGLVPGDICSWRPAGHTNVYVGKDANGQALWCDTGRGTGSDVTRMSIKALQEAGVPESTLTEDIKRDHNTPDLSKNIYVFNSLKPVGICLGSVKVSDIIRLVR